MNVQISYELFTELVKYFVLEEKTVERERYIEQEIITKSEKMSRRQEYKNSL